MLSSAEVILRVLLAALAGGLIGLERERSHKSAGLRTHTLVALGSALLTIVSISAFTDNVFADPTRIISNIVVGIGFIGGGAILQREDKIQGLTTAATLWVVAAIGITIGVGFYKIALVSAGLVYFVLTILWLIEKGAGKRWLYPRARN